MEMVIVLPAPPVLCRSPGTSAAKRHGLGTSAGDAPSPAGSTITSPGRASSHRQPALNPMVPTSMVNRSSYCGWGVAVRHAAAGHQFPDKRVPGDPRPLHNRYPLAAQRVLDDVTERSHSRVMSRRMVTSAAARQLAAACIPVCSAGYGKTPPGGRIAVGVAGRMALRSMPFRGQPGRCRVRR
jgi:hypothetical protein